jgi:hypothetical protein
LLLAAIAAFAEPRLAAAHGGATIDRDPCVQKTGSRPVHFTAYQPQFDPAGEYCADVPKSGSTIVVFDLVDPELRAIPLDLRVVKSANGGDETLLHVPAKLYANGVVNAEVELGEPGRYAALLTLENGPTVTFPLRVAMGYSPLVWILPLVGVAPALYYWSQRRSGAAEARRNLAVVK